MFGDGAAPAYRAWLAAGHGPRMLDDDILAAWACRPRKCLLLPKSQGCTDLPEPYAIGRRMPHRYGTAAKSGGNANEYSASRMLGMPLESM